jgi:hypothetical protein
MRWLIAQMLRKVNGIELLDCNMEEGKKLTLTCNIENDEFSQNSKSCSSDGMRIGVICMNDRINSTNYQKQLMNVHRFTISDKITAIPAMA